MEPKVVQGQTLFRSAEVRSINAEKREAEFVFTTGHRGKRSSWWSGEEWFEELAVDEKSIRLQRFQSGTSPFLKDHGWRLQDQLGVIVRAWIENGQGIILARFSEREDVEPIWKDIAAGICRSVSVGYNVYKWQDVTPDDGSLRVMRAVDWEPLECSLVTIGFDPGAMVRSAESGAPQPIPFQSEIYTRSAAGGRQDQGASVKTEPTTTTGTQGEQTTTVDAEKIRAEARAEAVESERKRTADITELCRKHKMDDGFDVKLVRDGATVEQARAAILEALATRSQAQPTNGQVRIEAGNLDENKTRGEAVVNSLLHRAFPTQVKLEESAKQFRGMSLPELCRAFLGQIGVNTSGMERSQVVREALRVRGYHSTSDFPYALAAVTGKSLLMGYEQAAARQTFRPFTKVAYAPDFKQVQRLRVGEIPTLEKVPEGAEVTWGTIGESKEVYNLSTYARIFGITREVLINDDLDAFTALPMKYGFAASRLESDVVWAGITGNPAMGDGNNLFDSANHGNHKASGGAAPDVTGLTAGRLAMRTQKGLSKKDYLNIAPKFLLVPAELETASQQLTVAITPAQVSNANPFQGTIVPIAEARLSANSATAWYLAADPAEGWDVMELLYLQGSSGPQVESEVGFDVNGIKVKALHDVAAKPMDWRTFYKNKGAA